MKNIFLFRHPEELRIFNQRLLFLNRDLTFFTAGLAISAACSDAPVQFGYASALLIVAIGHHFDKPYQRIFKLWREEKHPLIQIRRMWRSYIPFLISWLMLGTVASGLVNKTGFVWLA